MNTKEFEKQTLEQLLIDLKDIDNYKSFRKGAFVYDLGHYQGQLLLQEINRLNNIIDELEKYLEEESKYDFSDKKIEKIKLTNGGLTLHLDNKDLVIDEKERHYINKINEIIDKINKESEK